MSNGLKRTRGKMVGVIAAFVIGILGGCGSYYAQPEAQPYEFILPEAPPHAPAANVPGAGLQMPVAASSRYDIIGDTVVATVAINSWPFTYWLMTIENILDKPLGVYSPFPHSFWERSFINYGQYREIRLIYENHHNSNYVYLEGEAVVMLGRFYDSRFEIIAEFSVFGHERGYIDMLLEPDAEYRLMVTHRWGAGVNGEFLLLDLTY